jgi:hypothetical protein
MHCCLHRHALPSPLRQRTFLFCMPTTTSPRPILFYYYFSIKVPDFGLDMMVTNKARHLSKKDVGQMRRGRWTCWRLAMQQLQCIAHTSLYIMYSGDRRKAGNTVDGTSKTGQISSTKSQRKQIMWIDIHSWDIGLHYTALKSMITPLFHWKITFKFIKLCVNFSQWRP